MLYGVEQLIQSEESVDQYLLWPFSATSPNEVHQHYSTYWVKNVTIFDCSFQKRRLGLLAKKLKRIVHGLRKSISSLQLFCRQKIFTEWRSLQDNMWIFVQNITPIFHYLIMNDDLFKTISKLWLFSGPHTYKALVLAYDTRVVEKPGYERRTNHTMLCTANKELCQDPKIGKSNYATRFQS